MPKKRITKKGKKEVKDRKTKLEIAVSERVADLKAQESRNGRPTEEALKIRPEHLQFLNDFQGPKPKPPKAKTRYSGREPPIPPPQLLDLIHNFLKDFKYIKAAHGVRTDNQKRPGHNMSIWKWTSDGLPDLLELFLQWQEANPGRTTILAGDDPTPKRTEGMALGVYGSSQQLLSRKAYLGNKRKAGSQEHTDSSSAASDSDDSGLDSGANDEVDVVPVVPVMPNKRKRKASSTSEADSEDSSSSDNSGDGSSLSSSEASRDADSVQASTTKKRKLEPEMSDIGSDASGKAQALHVKVVPEPELSSPSSSNSHNDSGNDAKASPDVMYIPDLSRSDSALEDDSDSISDSCSSSSSSADSEAESEGPTTTIPAVKPDIKTRNGSSDSSATLPKPKGTKISHRKDTNTSSTSSSSLVATSSSSSFDDQDTQTQLRLADALVAQPKIISSKRKNFDVVANLKPETMPAAEQTAKRLKKENVPFSRIPENLKMDEKFSSNKYVSYDYADRAHQDLVVTKGKGFTKEKNKKKRGSYRGGAIDTSGGKGIKFDD